MFPEAHVYANWTLPFMCERTASVEHINDVLSLITSWVMSDNTSTQVTFAPDKTHFM